MITLTIITKSSILDVAAILDPPLLMFEKTEKLVLLVLSVVTFAVLTTTFEDEPLTIITKTSILDIATVLDPPLLMFGITEKLVLLLLSVVTFAVLAATFEDGSICRRNTSVVSSPMCTAISSLQEHLDVVSEMITQEL